jgi:hypothetical protein
MSNNNTAKNLQRALELVYYAIAIATFTHTMWAAAMVFQGSKPTGTLDQAWWYFQGALLAVAIDVGMILSARILAREWSWAMLAAFVLAAIASAYTQVLYATHHADAFVFGAGVTDEWVNRLQRLTDARVVLLPLALPAFAIIYTLSAHPTEEKQPEEPIITHEPVKPVVKVSFEVDSEDDDFAWSNNKGSYFKSEYTEKVYGPYDTALKRDIQQQGHRTREQAKIEAASSNGRSIY